MPFENPIVAGLKLLIRAIQSPDYDQGVSGWTINKDGSAEFNNLTIRGTFLGTDFEITSAGVFFYSAAPALGDLVISLAFVAGMDQYGNQYPAGLQILNHGGSGASGVAISYTLGAQPLIYFLSAVANIANDPALLVNSSGSGTSMFASFVISSAEDTTQGDYIAISLDASNEVGTHVPTVNVEYVDSTGTGHLLWSANLGGITSFGSMVALAPGSGTARTDLGVPETWHVATLGSGWGVISGLPPLQYRVTADDDLELIGCVQTTSATPAAAVTTLPSSPAGYLPSQDIRTGGCVQRLAGGDVAHALDIGTGGAVTLLNVPSATGVPLYFYVRVPLNPHP